MLFLDELILGFPGTTSKLRYGIPFYYKKSWICYLNPIKNQGVELAFTRANELSNEQGLLMSNGRKQVAGIAIYNINDLDIPLLTQVLSEALLLDEKVPYASKRKK
ncbi:MAG: hypothetical protein DHS20C17_27310 [Cyclobacteriaceae bacterium]|nr:MAG: hypothetical protein DHS20C17_27310 [Cyclobacteriaceae bacterium]